MAVKYRQTHVKTVNNYGAWLLYFYALPYLISIISKLLKGEVINLVLVSAVFVGVILSALWMSIGLKNKNFYSTRKYVQKPPFPMMFVASLLLGITSFISAWLLNGYNLFAGIGFGIAATIGCWLWYGIDPVKSKNISFSDINDSEKALEILQDSEILVVNIESSARHINNSEIATKLNAIASKAREVLNTLFENPKKIKNARRFLNTYLTGAESVVQRYVETHEKSNRPKLEANFTEVLENIESVFTTQNEKLNSSDVFDLDVDIEVLNTLLKKQGIK